jgi:dihydropyrimidinase
MKKLIKNGTLITEDEIKIADILFEDEKIIQVSSGITENNLEIVDAEGKLVMPGGVDAHVHLDLPMFNTVSSDDHYTGGKAAAFGGTTTMIDFISHDAGSLKENFSRLNEKAASKASIDYAFHMNITHFDDSVARQLEQLPGDGITSIKVFTAYNDRLRLDDKSIERVMQIAGRNGILTMLHAEDGDQIEILVDQAVKQGHREPYWHALTRPASGAVDAFKRIIELSSRNASPLYLVHMNLAGEADNLVEARSNGFKVMGETCPQYLFFSEADLHKPDGAKWVCSPPMRQVEDNQRLMQALTNDEIQVIATDHCPFFFDGTQPVIYEGQPVAIPGKELGRDDFTKIPNGLPGIADRMPVMWSFGVGKGLLTPNQFVKMMCTNPARIFGLYPRKGTIQVGSDADIVIWNPSQVIKYGVHIAHQRTDYNLYEGWDLTGYPQTVLLRGQILVDRDQWYGKPGMGQYLKCAQGEII